MVAAGGAFVNTFFTAAGGRCARVGADLAGIRWPASCSRWAATASCRARCSGTCRPSSAHGVYAILTVSAISPLAIWIDLAIPWRSVVSFGALVAFSVVNPSVIKHYFIDMRERNVLLNLIAPAIGFLLSPRGCGRAAVGYGAHHRIDLVVAGIRVAAG